MDTKITSQEKKWLIVLAIAVMILVTLIIFTIAMNYLHLKEREELLSGSSRDYLPSAYDLPSGFVLMSEEPTELDGGNMYTKSFTNPNFLIQGREVNVTYWLGIFDKATVAQEILDLLYNGTPSMTGIISTETDLNLEYVFSNTDDIKILFAHELTELNTYAINYTVFFRYKNSMSMLVVSAPVDTFDSLYAKNVKAMLRQAVLYYTNIGANKFPVPIIMNVPQPPFGAIAMEQGTGMVIEQVHEVEVEQIIGEENEAEPNPDPKQVTTSLPILWFDDFEDFQKTEQMWKVIHGDWEIVNGTYFCRAISHRCLKLAGDLGLKNYRLSLDIKGNEGVDKFVYVGFIEHERYYQLKFRSHPYNDLVLTEQLPERGITELQIVPIQNQNGYWYHFDVIVLENFLQVFIDNRLVMSAPNLPHSVTGRIGIGLMYSSAQGAGTTSVYFDNVKVAPYP